MINLKYAVNVGGTTTGPGNEILVTYHFKTHKEAVKAKNRYLTRGVRHKGKIYKTNKVEIFKLPSVKIGDTVCVLGEGIDTFKIVRQICYARNRYGYLLDAGWTEQAEKVHKPGQHYTLWWK